LEAHRGESWTPEERQEWQQKLALRRLVNMHRLRLYQWRGRFPVNEHVRDRAVPVFVDHYDTPCAVGHLMRESGWQEAVAEIEQTNDLVYVTDVREGALIEWVLNSGLIPEEAALIQPAYEPPPFNATMDVLTMGGSVTHAGLRYDNFVYGGGHGLPPALFQFPPFNELNLANVGVAARDDVYFDPCCGNDLSGVYDDWMLIGGGNFNGLLTVNAGQLGGVYYAYDVTAEDPGALIKAASVESIPIFTFNFANGGRIDVDTAVYSVQTHTQLASLHFDSTGNGGSYVFGEKFQDFTPTKKIRVETSVQLQGATRFSSLVHSFQVVPEPTAVIAAAGAFAVAMALRRRPTWSKRDHRSCG
jgi:hypothetical protein